MALATLPFVRMPVGMWLMTVAWALILVLIPFAGLLAIPFVAVFAWFGCLLVGMTLRTLMRTEAHLLPWFPRHLAGAGAVYALAVIVVPVLLAVACLYSPGSTALLAGTLALAATVGLGAGAGMRMLTAVWIFFVLPSLLPQALAAELLRVLVTSPWVPLLEVLLAALLLRFTLRPLLRLADPDDKDSPLQAVAGGRKPAFGTGGEPQRRGFIGRKLRPILDATAQHNLARAARRFQQHPSGTSRMAMIRAVLLPHDNAQGIAVNFVVTAIVAALYILLIKHDQNWSSGYVCAYAIIIGMSRFTAVGRGMVKMRPNLADLYLTLAPNTYAEFQATLADALLKLVAVTTFNCVLYAVLIVVLLHTQAPAEALLAVLIVGVGTGFAGLAVHLIGPESPSGRALVQIFLLAGAGGIYVLVLWLMHRFGVLAGGLAGLAICLPFGLGAWHYARREYAARLPIFDAPLD